jgi:hypothetical protein
MEKYRIFDDFDESYRLTNEEIFHAVKEYMLRYYNIIVEDVEFDDDGVDITVTMKGIDNLAEI